MNNPLATHICKKWCCRRRRRRRRGCHHTHTGYSRWICIKYSNRQAIVDENCQHERRTNCVWEREDWQRGRWRVGGGVRRVRAKGKKRTIKIAYLSNWIPNERSKIKIAMRQTHLYAWRAFGNRNIVAIFHSLTRQCANTSPVCGRINVEIVLLSVCFIRLTGTTQQHSTLRPTTATPSPALK